MFSEVTFCKNPIIYYVLARRFCKNPVIYDADVGPVCNNIVIYEVDVTQSFMGGRF